MANEETSMSSSSLVVTTFCRKCKRHQQRRAPKRVLHTAAAHSHLHRWTTVAAVYSILMILLANIVCHTADAASDFEPYDMNGGLVAAVAGRDWTVIATDTRCSSSYNILQRNHVSSRLWVASSSCCFFGNDEQDYNNESGDSTSSDSDILKTIPWIGRDGSVSITPTRDGTNSKVPPLLDNNNNNNNNIDPLVSTTILSQAPTLIASAGCQADCETLKRLVRSDLRAVSYFGGGGGAAAAAVPPAQVATLLSQMLYGRRGFPFYSFCVVAGLAGAGDGTVDNANGAGQVFVYDAIGSYEQVAVASTGTGKELMQPILDRQFRTFVNKAPSTKKNAGSSSSTSTTAATTTNGLAVQTPVSAVASTQVDCTKEEAVSILVDAYRSVSEREIGVGDQVVFCVLQRQDDGTVECQVIRYPLKQH